MAIIYLTPSKQDDFKGILNDLRNNIEPVMEEAPYNFLIDELQKLYDLYIELEDEKNEIENEQNILVKQVDYLFKENLKLEQKVENL